MSLAPLSTALLTWRAITGWSSVVLVPMAKTHPASPISSIELVIAPLPKLVARPATVGACQRRAQCSTLFVSITQRANFWNTKLSSLVHLADDMAAN